MILWDNSKTTLELGEMIESGVDIWAFDYPSYYKDAEKTAFEQKVIDHYRFRQIGQETPGRWLHYFRTRMQEIMPYYIQLYESQALMQSLDDPFGNVDITETFEETRTGESSGSSSSTDTGQSNAEGGDYTDTNLNTAKKFSNTPQGSIENLDTYLTEATVDIGATNTTVTHNNTVNTLNNGETTTTGSESGSVKHTLTRKGNQGVNTYAHDMRELRETFLNIDLQIIRELNDLFLGVY